MQEILPGSYILLWKRHGGHGIGAHGSPAVGGAEVIMDVCPGKIKLHLKLVIVPCHVKQGG